MSLKKLHLYRNKIEQAVREFVGDNVLQIEVQSSQKIKYSVSFADEKVLPAMVFVDYNQDGTTTIEDSRGRNKEYAAKLAEYIANSLNNRTLIAHEPQRAHWLTQYSTHTNTCKDFFIM